MAQRIVNLKELERRVDRLAAEIEVATTTGDQKALATAKESLDLLKAAVEQARDAVAAGRKTVDIRLPKTTALSRDLALDDHDASDVAYKAPPPKVPGAIQIEARDLP